jgi:hypothetical protein
MEPPSLTHQLAISPRTCAGSHSSTWTVTIASAALLTLETRARAEVMRGHAQAQLSHGQ